MKQDKIQGLIVDLDGTLYFKGEVIPGVIDTLKQLRKLAVPIRFITNSDSKPVGTIRRNLADMGINVEDNEIISPVTVAMNLLQAKPGQHCFTILSPALEKEFENYRISTDDRVEWVILGDISEMCSYALLDRAFNHLMNGAELLTLQPGRFYIDKDGYHLDTGAFSSLLEYSSGKKARILGKPSNDIFQVAIEQLGLETHRIAIIGDDITTDITGAKALEVLSVLVRTGKYKDNTNLTTGVVPDYIIESFPDILSLFWGTEQ